MTDQVEHDGRVLRQGRTWRARQAAKRGVHALTAKLWSSFWLIVIFAVIMASLVALGDLSVGLGLASFVGFVAAVLLLPLQETDQDEAAAFAPSKAVNRSRSPMSTVVGALPDPAILLSPTGQVVFFNAPAKGLFASLREGSHISSRDPRARISRCGEWRLPGSAGRCRSSMPNAFPSAAAWRSPWRRSPAVAT